MLLVLTLPQFAFSASVSLEWDPSSDYDLAGYKVYYQADSAVLPFQGAGAAEGSAPIDMANALSTVVSGLDPASTYYFAVTVYNTAGVESAYSNIIEIPESLPPTVAISSPANNAAVQGTVAVSAAASDNKGVARVEFYLDGALQASDTTAPYEFSWNTSSLTAGQYLLLAKAYDAAGNVGQSAEMAVNVTGDHVPPTVAFSQPGNNASVSGSVTITANATDDSGVSRIEIYQDAVLAFASNQNPTIFNWNSLPVANGTHNFSAKAYDAAGNVGEANLVLTVANNDATAPTVALTAPVSGSTVSGLVTVSATATDNLAVTKVEFYLNGTLQRTVSTVPYGFSWNTAALANGLYLLRAKAYDAAGNAGQSAELRLTVSNSSQAPVVTITAPGKSATLTGTVLVSASATDSDGVSKVEFYVNGLLVATSSKAPYGFNWSTGSLANGSYILSAKAYDTKGSVGQSASVTVNVFNDSSAPLVAIGSPVAGSTVSGTVAVSAIASDNVAVTKVEFYLNGALQATSVSAPYSFNWSTAALANGAYTLSAKAYDAAGNVGQSAAVVANVFYDRSAPTITAFSMPTSTNSSTVPVTSLSATDNVAVSRYLVTESATVPSASDERWSATAPTSFTFAGTGLLTAYAWALDAAGNVSAGKAVSVMMDTTLPIISSMTLKSSSFSLTVNASATDNLAVDKMELYLNNVLQLQTNASSLSYVCQLSSKGGQAVTVKVYDAAGNVRVRSLTAYKY